MMLNTMRYYDAVELKYAPLNSDSERFYYLFMEFF